MTFYHTICGRTVRKSTNADTTGNRDTAECTGCPFLLPYGPFQWDDKTNTYHREIQGHECRMPKCDIDYASRFSGSIENRLTCAVHSLDFDFLTRVSDWIAATYPGKEIQGHFDADTIRGVEYVSAGRYRMTVNCAQNKAGEAAKAALFHQFFNDDGSRKDMTPEEEKEKVLDLIRRSIGDTDQKEGTNHSNNAEYTPDEEYIGSTGDRYRIHHNERAKLYRTEVKKNGSLFWVPNNSSFYTELEDACREFDAVCCVYDLKKYSSPCDICRCPDCDDDDCCQAKCDKADAGLGCMGSDDDCPRLNVNDDDQAIAETPAAPVCSDLPEFDYSGLTDQTVATLHSAENMIRTARRDYVIKVADAVGMAHDELSSSENRTSSHSNQYTEDTFIAWCRSVGISKSTAYQLLQVSNLLDKSTPNEQKVLEQAPASLLYAAAKPSAPAELVEGVKSGDITTNKQYQDALLRIETLENQNKSLLNSYESERGKASAAERKQQETDKQLEANRGLLVNIKRSNDDLRAKMQELENRPIEVATEVDYAEVERLAKEKADAATAELRAALEEAKKKTGITQKFDLIATGNARDGALTCASVIRSTWKTFKPMLLLVTDDIDKKYAVEDFLAAINEVKEDAEKCL
ncbi:MAG: hypothetical protein GXW99_05295 [Clostridiales bacterium]|nr:hypothetical protein [Clostridiales bacterium]